MFEVSENPNLVERAFLVGVRRGKTTAREAEEHLEELAQLVDTLGIPVVGQDIVTLHRPNPALLVGKGKAEDLATKCELVEADCLIFDDELAPAQQRNWERLTRITVIDRHEVILDIFAKHARTKAARLQVKLARLEYQLPRLRRAWTHLERQRGGTGMRGGAGELQLEADQRMIRDQIIAIKRELQTLRRRRSTQRKSRGIKPTPNAVIVGYTNAGKSSLLNALTNAGVVAEDKLFATLDPTTRRIQLPNNQELLLTDTVGFIRKLPHDLVESFHATLEETQLAEFLIHVVDVSHPQAHDHVAATQAVLKELKVEDKPVLLVLNKIDALNGADPMRVREFSEDAEKVVAVSALEGEGLDELTGALADMLPAGLQPVVLEIPPERYDLVSLAYREGDVQLKAHLPGATWLRVNFPKRILHRVEKFVRPGFPAEVEEALAHGRTRTDPD